MNINANLLSGKKQMIFQNKNQDFIEKNTNNFGNSEKNFNNSLQNNDKLKKVVKEFSSIFIKKMFKSMRDTLPEKKLIDGGFGEDVYTDMLDKEISKLGAKQNGFDNLNKMLYQQLLRKQMMTNKN